MAAATVEAPPPAGPSVPPPATNAGETLALLRGTPEYAALFDLEMWKAEQQAKFLQHHEQGLAVLRQKLESEFAQRDAARVAELDGLREELEMMAHGLQRGGEALQQRIVALEQREAEFEQRRVNVARVHEAGILDAEAKARRVVDEMRLKLESEESKNREKELMVQNTLARMQALYSEHQALQALLTKLQGREGHDRAALVQVQQRCDALTNMLQAARSDSAAACKARDEALGQLAELKEACNFYKAQLQQLAAQHNSVLHRVHREQANQVAEDRHRLVQDERRIAAAAAAAGVSTAPRHVWADEVIGTNRGEGASSTPGGTNHSEIAQLRGLIENLAKATAKAEEKSKHDGQEQQRQQRLEQKRALLAGRRVPPPNLAVFGGDRRAASYVPVPSDAHPLAQQSPWRPGLTAPQPQSHGPRTDRGHPCAHAREDDANSREGGSRRQRLLPSTARAVKNADEGDAGCVADDGQVSLSSLSERDGAVGADGPRIDEGPEGSGSSDNGGEGPREERDELLGAGHPTTLSQQQQQQQQTQRHGGWVAEATAVEASTEEDDDERHRRPKDSGDHAVARGTSEMRPPRSPKPLVATAEDGFGDVLAVRTKSVDTSTEEDYPLIDLAHLGLPPLMAGLPTAPFSTAAAVTGGSVQGVNRSPPRGGLLSATRTASFGHPALQHSSEIRRDVEDFVTRLQRNKLRLLGTGVYTEEDPLIKEMTQKIEVYEQFLRGVPST